LSRAASIPCRACMKKCLNGGQSTRSLAYPKRALSKLFTAPWLAYAARLIWEEFDKNFQSERFKQETKRDARLREHDRGGDNTNPRHREALCAVAIQSRLNERWFL